MKYVANSLIVLTTIITISACQYQQKQTTQLADTVLQQPEAPNPKLETTLPPFPNMAYKIESLIPKDYDIDLEAEGDLNNDGVADKVIVLINTVDTTALRPTLVLLKQGNAHSVNAISYSVLEPKYREDGYKIYDHEDVSIDSGKLVFTMQAIGPAGSIESTYKYIKNDLVLTHISTFNMGAGGQTGLEFDLLNGIYEQTDINTMKEDMPSETTTKKYKIPIALFKDSSPNEIMGEAFKKNGN